MLEDIPRRNVNAWSKKIDGGASERQISFPSKLADPGEPTGKTRNHKGKAGKKKTSGSSFYSVSLFSLNKERKSHSSPPPLSLLDSKVACSSFRKKFRYRRQSSLSVCKIRMYASTYDVAAGRVALSKESGGGGERRGRDSQERRRECRKARILQVWMKFCQDVLRLHHCTKRRDSEKKRLPRGGNCLKLVERIILKYVDLRFILIFLFLLFQMLNFLILFNFYIIFS